MERFWLDAANHNNTVLSYKRFKKGKGSPYSINERWVAELIPVLGSQPLSLQVT